MWWNKPKLETKEIIVLVQDVNGGKIRDALLEEMSIQEFLVFIGFTRSSNSNGEYAYYSKNNISIYLQHRMPGTYESITITMHYSNAYHVSKNLQADQISYKTITEVINVMSNLKIGE